MTYSVYTDGSASPNPGAGGYGVVICQDRAEPVELLGGFRFTTNNRMELMAAIVALGYLPPGSKETLFFYRLSFKSFDKLFTFVL